MDGKQDANKKYGKSAARLIASSQLGFTLNVVAEKLTTNHQPPQDDQMIRWYRESSD